MAVLYEPPTHWITYDRLAIVEPLTAARAAMLALTQMPYQRSWADELQRTQLKREVAGTSRIEGADFTEQELEAALAETPGELATRSQRQAAAAVATYRWIASLPSNLPVNTALICEVHRRIVSGCDDDHCPPGALRTPGQNVTFGSPRHRGAEGGAECVASMRGLTDAVQSDFRGHDPLVQALAVHYHLAAMHPFLDGNGRTARALEAMLLQRTGLRDALFIAMSNFYFEEQTAYLAALAAARERGHDLTPFLQFALRGVETQCRRLLDAIRTQLVRALFRNTMLDLFGRLRTPRKRVMSARHVQLLTLLLDDGGELPVEAIAAQAHRFYAVKNPHKALTRDLSYLVGLGALRMRRRTDDNLPLLTINLDWPSQITETEFLRRVKALPKGKVYRLLSS